MVDISRLGDLQDIEKVRVDRRFAPADLDDLGPTFGLQEPIEYLLHLDHAQVIAGASISEAGGAIQIASGGDLDQAHASMLLMLGAKAAVEGTPLFDIHRKVERDGPWPVVLERIQVPASVG